MFTVGEMIGLYFTGIDKGIDLTRRNYTLTKTLPTGLPRILDWHPCILQTTIIQNEVLANKPICKWTSGPVAAG